LAFLAEHRGEAPSLASLASLGRGDLTAWLAFRAARRLQASSTARALSALRGFFRFLAPRGLIVHAAVIAPRIPKVPTAMLKALSEAEAMDAVEKVGELGGEAWIAKRDAALLTLLYGCGLRLGEALSLRRADVRAARAGRLVITGKGRKQRVVPVLPIVAAAFGDYAAA